MTKGTDTPPDTLNGGGIPLIGGGKAGDRQGAIPLMPDREAAQRARDEWPAALHPRLGLGPKIDDIVQWHTKHAATVFKLLDAYLAAPPSETVDDLLKRVPGEVEYHI